MHSSSMRTRQDYYGVSFVLATPLHPLVPMSCWTKDLQHIFRWVLKQQPSNLHFLWDIGEVLWKKQIMLFLGGSLQHMVCGMENSGEHLLKRPLETEVHNLKLRDVTMVNKWLFFCICCNPILLLAHGSTIGQGTNQFCLTITHQKWCFAEHLSVKQIKMMFCRTSICKTNYIVGDVLAARSRYI